ncbi:MAG: helix-turn-helix domain-containing protein [Pseudomonas sp.]|nr:helix-turn-helix domain-containing protein [Pseudomonas sp.]
MKNKPLPLTDDEILRLQQIVRKGTDWRSRSRAEILLRLARGESVQAVAEALEICKKTVYERRQQWLSKAMSQLVVAMANGLKHSPFRS